MKSEIVTKKWKSHLHTVILNDDNTKIKNNSKRFRTENILIKLKNVGRMFGIIFKTRVAQFLFLIQYV